MQKGPPVSEARKEISDIQNNPVVQKLFEDAIEVLRLAGADKKATVPSEDEQETAVHKMLCYVDQMPSQETFQPPSLPFVSFAMDKDENENPTSDNPSNSTESIQDCTYLSSEKDLTLWKMLVASPTNCNVFVGGLAHGVTSEMLHAAFEAFSLKEDDKPQIKTHVVMDVARHQSKGYGFVSFPCRRSAELAMICMQEFEIYGRSMQLGWGQENREEQPSRTQESQETKIGQQQHAKEPPTRMSIKPKGDIVSDTVFSNEVDFAPKQPLKRCSSRWDQEAPKMFQRIEDTAKLDPLQCEPNQKNKEDSFFSAEMSLDDKGTYFDREGFSSSSGGVQDPNRFVIETEKVVETRRITTDKQEIFCGKASTDQNPRKAIQWLTHDQKVALIKSVCSKLRGFGVRGHLGVFGVYYEADNSRLYVVCAKTVTEAQLLDEFKVFGTSDVKLNKDVNGFSKGCAFVQYTDSACAERAIKQLHGKVVGGMPMKVMVAEPKVRKGSRGKKTMT
ncbi:hypothetical protein ACROYT_G039771 [Oculina patagonica]